MPAETVNVYMYTHHTCVHVHKHTTFWEAEEHGGAIYKSSATPKKKINSTALDTLRTISGNLDRGRPSTAPQASCSI
jgi:hypothetical protein